jgi:hypothetical protein
VILGQHTVAELRYLVAAKDVQTGALVDQAAKYRPAWEAKDKAQADEWFRDFAAYRARYAEARKKAAAQFAWADNHTSVSDNVVPAEAEWQAVIRAVKQAGDSGPETKGDLIDLHRRFWDAGGPSFTSQVPQPSASSDVDLTALNQSTTVLGNIDPHLVGKTGMSTLEKSAIAVAVVGALGVFAYFLNQITFFLPKRRS